MSFFKLPNGQWINRDGISRVYTEDVTPKDGSVDIVIEMITGTITKIRKIGNDEITETLQRILGKQDLTGDL